MHYQVVFDITQTEFSHWSALWFALAVAVFSVLVFGLTWRQKKRFGFRAFIFFTSLAIFLLVANGIASLLFGFSWHDYQQLKTATQSSQCKVVEGIVSNLRQGSFWGDGGEKGFGEMFSVGGQEFRCRSEGGMQNGFHKANVVREGMQVRIHYYDDLNKAITRLEIAQ